MMTDADRKTWVLQGTPRQQRIAAAALASCDYPWEVARPGLNAKTGRESIPVDWQDLSTWGATAARTADDHDDHLHGHHHGEPGGDGYHTLEARNRTLGLAWYAGRVTLDVSLEHDEQLAAEVLLSEGAHMADFFALTDDQRQAIYAAFHDDDETPHGHGWFDVATYREFVGEAFMGGFIRAFAPSVPVTIPFAHPATPEVGERIRRVMLDPVVFGLDRSVIYHDSHRGVRRQRHWPDRNAARDAGRIPCAVCKP